MSKSKNSVDWSDNDLQIIRDNYDFKTTKEIIPLLSTKRTERAVRHKVQILGLRKMESYIGDYENLKYKIIDNNLNKYCKSCKRYLPMAYDYFPKDTHCTDSFRNVCRECKGGNFRIESNIHIWTEVECHLLMKHYPNFSNKELINTYFNCINIAQIVRKAYQLKIQKSKDTLDKMYKEIGKFNSDRLEGTDKWKSEDNPQYNSKRFGSINHNYNGGISALYQELRRNIKQWKIDSIENGNYVSVLTGNRFDVVHHLYSFGNIVKDTLTETGLPLYEDISFYSNEEIKQLIDKCIEIHYRHPLGVCLEEKYHAKFHEEFGYGSNTEDQFYEFLDNYYNGKYKYLEEII